MNLTPDFQFSQSSLQDYQDCQRRFELRYILRQAWPAVQVEPLLEQEKMLQQGELFHRMAQQYILGLPLPPLTDPDLRGWWEQFLQHGLQNLPQQRQPEVQLSIRLAGYPIVCRYDLLAVQPGEQAVIVDWKTTHQRPKRPWLERRLQTRVYRYVLVRAGARWNNGVPFQPEQITMRYWFAHTPTQPENLPYSRAQFEQDEAYLKDFIQQIAAQTEFPLTAEEKKCHYCTYRSLCRRGERAGSLYDEAMADDEDYPAPPLMELEF